MSTNKRALRDKIQLKREILDTQTVIDVDELEALLDELEAAERRNAELSASHSNLREAMAGIHNTITGGGAYTPLVSILNASKRAYEESVAAAGITVKGDSE